MDAGERMRLNFIGIENFGYVFQVD